MKRWTKEEIARLIEKNDFAVEKAMLALYRRQTSDEQSSESTKHSNKKGFSAAHARRGSYYARWVQGGRRLTGRHLDNARSIASHYTQQLLDEARARVGA